jgi:hypothetical protein
VKDGERHPITLFNHNFELPTDVSNIFGFEITAYPAEKPKFITLDRRFNGDNLTLCEVGQGSYRLERITSLVDARFNVYPSLYEEQSKGCEITIACEYILYKNIFIRTEIVDFAKDISSRISWKHKIVWFTYDGNVTEWKCIGEK